SELLQHEYDHLDGILAVDRATDTRSICYKCEVQSLVQ
ncbi:MAG: peptide deformylase, partial [Candidatus Thorarchaeota archaeon]